jgi:hypothetical protein
MQSPSAPASSSSVTSRAGSRGRRPAAPERTVIRLPRGALRSPVPTISCARPRRCPAEGCPIALRSADCAAVRLKASARRPRQSSGRPAQRRSLATPTEPKGIWASYDPAPMSPAIPGGPAEGRHAQDIDSKEVAACQHARASSRSTSRDFAAAITPRSCRASPTTSSGICTATRPSRGRTPRRRDRERCLRR